MSVLDVAQARQDRLIRINKTVTNRGLRLWDRMTPDFDASYGVIEPELNAQVVAAQLAAAGGANWTASRFVSEHGFDADSNVIIPQAFSGVDASGRGLGGLLFGAVTTSKQAVGAGLGTSRALEAGAAYLAAMIKTAIADVGRSSDLTAATGRGFTHYVRVINPGACSRCAALAGIDSYRNAFKRHPACKCTTAPLRDDGTTGVGGGMHDTPQKYFDSLSTAEQDRIFTRGGAEAIRSGADPTTVVSARRGAKGIEYGRNATLPNSGRRLERSVIGTRPDGTPILGYTTGEGTTVRGAFGKQQMIADTNAVKVGNNRYRTVQRDRLMPETIVGLTDDVELRQVLLRDAGYMERRIVFTNTNDWIRLREAGIREDRERADAFYRSIGVTL